MWANSPCQGEEKNRASGYIRRGCFYLREYLFNTRKVEFFM